MQKSPTSQSGIFTPRILLAFVLCCFGVLLTMFGFAGTLSSSAKTRAISPTPASGGPTTNLSNGITFDHATWNDPIRMVGEPDIVIDNNGGIYISGPGQHDSILMVLEVHGQRCAVASYRLPAQVELPERRRLILRLQLQIHNDVFASRSGDVNV